MSCSWTFLLNPNQPKSNFSSDLRTAHSNIFLCLLSFKVAKAGDYHFAIFKQTACATSVQLKQLRYLGRGASSSSRDVCQHHNPPPRFLLLGQDAHYGHAGKEFLWRRASCQHLDSNQRKYFVVLFCECFCPDVLEVINRKRNSNPQIIRSKL